MAYCKNCGKEVSEFAANCPECGSSQRKANGNNNTNALDNGGFGWGLLGFCIPIVGIILYFVWKDERPITSKVLLQWALISIAINVFASIGFSCVGALSGL